MEMEHLNHQRVISLNMRACLSKQFLALSSIIMTAESSGNIYLALLLMKRNNESKHLPCIIIYPVMKAFFIALSSTAKLPPRSLQRPCAAFQVAGVDTNL